MPTALLKQTAAYQAVWWEETGIQRSARVSWKPVVVSVWILVDLACSYGNGSDTDGVAASRFRSSAMTRSTGRSGVT